MSETRHATTIPAMCGNGHYYLDEEHIALAPGQRITISGTTGTGPCPVCGAGATFEAGVYFEPATRRQRLAIIRRELAALIRGR